MGAELYFFNDQYDGPIVDEGVNLCRDMLYSRALSVESVIADMTAIYGTMSNFKVNNELNLLYKLPDGTYTYSIKDDIIPYYSKSRFLDVIKYGQPITLIDIVNNYKIFSKRLVFTIDKYLFLMLRVILTRDGTILAIYNNSTTGISQARLNTFIASNAVWTLLQKNTSDFYSTYKIKTSLFTASTNNINLTQMTSKLAFLKQNKVNSYNIAITASTTDINLLAQSTATLGTDTNGTSCFTISNAFKSYIFANSNNCMCYVFHNHNKAGYTNISTPGKIRIPIVTNPIPVSNINIWEYDSVNDIKLVKTNITPGHSYPNIYDFGSLPSGKNYYIDWYSPDTAPITFDNNFKDYNACYPSTLASLLSYSPLASFTYDYDDLLVYDPTGKDIRGYKMSKLLQLLSDNTIRYNAHIKRLNFKIRKYISKIYNMSNYPNIYGRSVTSNSGQIHNPSNVVTFPTSNIYLAFSNAKDINRDVILFIDGKRVIPTGVYTENGMTYVYIPKSKLTSTSKVIVEMTLTPASSVNKHLGTFQLTAANAYVPFPSSNTFGAVAGKDLIYYDQTSLAYYDPNLFKFAVNVKSELIYNDKGDSLYNKYSATSNISYLLTNIDEFYSTNASEHILLSEETQMVENASSFYAYIPTEDAFIATADVPTLNKPINVTNTNNFRCITLPNLATSATGVFATFTEDPAADRFRVYVNGLLIDSTKYTYTPPSTYGGNASFTITSYTPSGGTDTAIIEYLPYKEVNVLDQIVTANQVYDTDVYPLLYYTNLFNLSPRLTRPFDKNVAKVYVNGARISPSNIIEVRGNNIIKITGFTSGSRLRIDIPAGDSDCYGYTANASNMVINTLFDTDATFRNYINNNY